MRLLFWFHVIRIVFERYNRVFFYFISKDGLPIEGLLWSKVGGVNPKSIAFEYNRFLLMIRRCSIKGSIPACLAMILMIIPIQSFLMNQIYWCVRLSRFSFPARKRAGFRSSPLILQNVKPSFWKRNYFVKCLYNFELSTAFWIGVESCFLCNLIIFISINRSELIKLHFR
jgi:hypothetical protein